MPNFGRSKKKKTTIAKALKKTSRRGSLGDAFSVLRLETTTEEEEEEEKRKNESEKKKKKKTKGKTPRDETKKNANDSYRPPYEWLEDDEEDIDSLVLPRVCTERDSNLAFKGFDITTFFGSERWQFESDVYGEDKVSRGNEKFSCSMMCGPKNEMVTFYFKSKVNLLKFQKRPRRYIPVCGGFCCIGAIFSTSPDSCCYDRLFRADPSQFARKNQKVYMFADEESKRYFLSHAKEMAEVCEEAFERKEFQENAEVCDGGYQSEYGYYSPFGKYFDGYPEHFN
jgi:YHS domain-containing protein